MSFKHNTNQNKDMSPFTIFFLVVTFLYIIYYAVIITIDINSKPKSESDHSETLDTEGMLSSEEASDDNPDDGSDDEESSSSPLPEETPSDDENPFEEPETDEPYNIPSQAEEVDDNPYGLTDEEPTVSEPMSEDQAETDEVNDTDNQETPSEEPFEPEVMIYEPEPVNGGIAVDINNNNEHIEAESLTPCKPNMLADNVFDIAGIKQSFYGSETPEQQTLSEKLPMGNDEEPLPMDRI